MPAIIQGQSDLVRRGRFMAALKQTEMYHTMRMKKTLEVVIQDTIDDLRALTPKDTGAAAGTQAGARREIYPNHPAAKLGLPIGNFEGASGWQPKDSDNGKRWSIINPMWDIYLKYRNYLGGVGSNFVEEAARRMRDRLRNMRKH